MRVSKNKVVLLSAAVASLFATAAQAQLNLNTGANPVRYASEIAFPTGGTTLTIPAASVVSVGLGFGFSNGQDRYVRFDLPSGVTWGAALTAASLTTAGGTVLPAGIIVSQGGTTADSFVIFQLTGGAAGVPFTETLKLTIPSVKLPTATSVPLTYTLHETGISAQGGTPVARLFGPVTANLITFTPAINVVASTATTETISATASLFKFCDGGAGLPGTANCAATATDLIALVGGVATYGWNLGPILSLAGVDLTLGADLTAVLTAATVSATGDLAGTTAAGFLTQASAAALACPTVGASGTRTATAATYTTGTALLAAGSSYALCVTANGTSVLPAQSFTGSFNPTYAAGYAGAARSLGTIGTWTRDGAELQSPWFSFGGTRYISRFFFMNTGANPATCTATPLAEMGNTLTTGSAVTTGFTIPANGQVAVLATDVVSAATVAGRAAVRFVCLAPSVNIQGRYVITDTTSGSLDSGHLMRPGTN
jgi:hypothetical protein